MQIIYSLSLPLCLTDVTIFVLGVLWGAKWPGNQKYAFGLYILYNPVLKRTMKYNCIISPSDDRGVFVQEI